LGPLLIAIHIVACVTLIVIVLLQQGKGASMGAAFGGSSQTVFGSAGATPFLGKVTTAVAVIFMLTSLFLAFLSGPRLSSTSVVDGQQQTQEAPANPQAPASPQAPAQEQGAGQTETK